ncbi:unnamed protein product [Auanema sp. JU1783]|nr:unnamed protein product [Auanema sp. JU1783]
MLYAILKWNQKELASTSQSTFSYDLSKRYQLKENVFSTNVLLTFTTTLAITNFVLIPLLIIVKLGFGEIIGMCGTILHFEIFSLWNQIIFSLIPFLNLLIHPIFRTAVREHPIIKKYFYKKHDNENNIKKETRIYFDGLRNQWDNSYSVKTTSNVEQTANYKPSRKEKYPKQ